MPIFGRHKSLWCIVCYSAWHLAAQRGSCSYMQLHNSCTKALLFKPDFANLVSSRLVGVGRKRVVAQNIWGHQRVVLFCGSAPHLWRTSPLWDMCIVRTLLTTSGQFTFFGFLLYDTLFCLDCCHCILWLWFLLLEICFINLMYCFCLKILIFLLGYWRCSKFAVGGSDSPH